MKNGFVNANVKKQTQKQYGYHGTEMQCEIQPDPEPEDYFINKYGPFPIFETKLKITTVYQCGETHWPPNLFSPLGYVTCDPNFVREDDSSYLYTKTRWWVGNGQALYNKESLLDKLKYKVIAIQSITVYMKGEVFIHVPGTHYNCGPSMGKLYVACSNTVGSWQGVCKGPGSIHTVGYEWVKRYEMHTGERNWDMEYLEEKVKIGFRVDKATEDDPADYGVNRTRGYYVYCKVKYKKSLVVSLGFGSLEWYIGPTWVYLSGRVIGGGNGYFIYGFQLWKRGKLSTRVEETSKGNINDDNKFFLRVFNGLTPETVYSYRALLRNTGIQGDTLYGVTKGFTTKS